MKKYFINSQEVSIQQWQERFRGCQDASVILKLPVDHPVQESRPSGDVVSPERIKEIRAEFLEQRKKYEKNLYQK